MPIDDQLVGAPRTVDEDLSVATLWYRLELHDETLDVALRLFAPPQRTKFFLPAEWAGRDDYADAIRIAGAQTEDGPVDIAISRSRGEVEVGSAGAEWVELRYRVDLSPRSRFHAQLDGGVLLAFGPTFLVTPSQQIMERTRQIPIEVWLPNGWTTAATWAPRGARSSRSNPRRDVHSFVARDVRELRDAFLVAGANLRTATHGEDEDRVVVAFGPTFEGDIGTVSRLVNDVVGQYRETFGPAGPVTAHVRARGADARELGGLGRRGGFVVDLPPDERLSDDARLLVAHEALHLWNGHLLVPEPSDEANTRWFKEGVTHYLALKLLRRAGHVDDSFVLDELTEVAGNYRRNPVRVGAEGRPVDRARFPYDHGVLVALAFDAALWAASDGTTGLEDWLRELLDAEQPRYDERRLLEVLQRVAPPGASKSVADIWRRYIRAREPIALAKLFHDVGLHWLPPLAERRARLIPLDGAAGTYRALFSPQENL